MYNFSQDKITQAEVGRNVGKNDSGRAKGKRISGRDGREDEYVVQRGERRNNM